MSNEFSINPDLPAAERHQLAAYLEETARRALSGGGDQDDLSAAFIRVLGARVASPGPVTIRIGQLDADRRLVVRRILYTAHERAAKGDAGPVIAGAMSAILGGWERTIRYDPQPRYEGPRNIWGEPSSTTRTRGLGGVGQPIAR